MQYSHLIDEHPLIKIDHSSAMDYYDIVHATDKVKIQFSRRIHAIGSIGIHNNQD